MSVKLVHGDCLKEMQNIPDGSIDLCLTDPPYGTTACKWDSVIPFEPMWEQLKRIVKPNGAICLFGSEPFSSALRMSNIKMFKYDWYWRKNSCTGAMLAKKQPMKNTEIISVFYRNQSSYYPIYRERKCNPPGNKKPRLNTITNSIAIDKDTKPKNLKYPSHDINIKAVHSLHKVHTSQKPVPLLEYLIKTYTLEGETVLDFTMGSGSTGVAAKNLNRKFIGIEQDDKYFEIAKERIEEHEPQLGLL